MILPDSEVALLKGALRCWEWFGYISTAVVGLGCIGEFIAEFTSLSKKREAAHKLAGLSLFILIVGIAGELLSGVRTSQISGQLIANIEERAAQAEHEAEAANERASQIEQENIKLRIELAKLQRTSGPRYLTDDEKQELAHSLKKYDLQRVNIVCVIGDTESARLGDDFEAVFARLGLKASRGWLQNVLMEDANGKRIDVIPPGITIWVSDPSKPPPVA